MRVISNAGPGVKHDIQRALNVRNLSAKTALTKEQAVTSIIKALTSPSRGCATWMCRGSIR